MGEIPLEVKVIFEATEIDEYHEEEFVVYWCEDCERDFLIQDYLEDAFCPFCGNGNTYMQEEIL